MILERLSAKYGHKKILVTSSDSTGCGLMRAEYPHRFLKDSFEWCEHSSGFPSADPRIHEADIVWLQRPNHEFFLTYIPEMQRQGKFVIIDLDDTLWDIPASNLAGRFYGKKELAKVEAVFKLADCLTTSTIPLQEFLEKKFNKKTFVIPNHLVQDEIFLTGEKEKNDKIKIGWAGSYTHAGDFDHHLVNVLRGLPKDKVEFYSMGYMPQFFKGFAKELPWIETSQFHKTFREQNWDIGIMVAQDSMFNRCKSNLKYLEYGATKTAVVGHSVYPYINTVEHGVDGFLVQKEKTDWKEYIYTLIENESLRLQMANAAYNKVKKNFTYEENHAALEQIYLDIFAYLGV
jgi:glycosyltransferase involved in cell wall biosynthesis